MGQETSSKNLLLVDDEQDIVNILKEEFEELGHNVQTASSGNKAWEIFKDQPFDIVISDVRMPDGDGIFLLKKVKESNPKTRVLIITGYTEYSVEELKRLGAEKLIHKPFQVEELVDFVEQI